MRTDKIRKYLISNIPYLFILWAFLKLGTAYRLAAGNDFAHKLIGLGQTIGPAFADFAPSLAPLDWLVGIVVFYCPFTYLRGCEGEYIIFLGNFILAQHSAGILFKYGRCS